MRLVTSLLLEEETLFYRIDGDWTPLWARERRYGASMFALVLLLLVMVLLVGVGLFINVYLYKYHALKTVDAHFSLDEQLFVYYGDIDACEVW